MRHIRYLALVMLLTAITGSLRAADNWFMYLFDNVTQELVRVEASGAHQNVPLMLNEGEYISMSDVAISSDGRSAAYCKTSAPSNAGRGDKTLIVQDLDTGAERLRVPYGNIAGCIASGFSDDNQYLAVSLINEEPYLPNVEDTPIPDWELRVLSLRDGQVIDSIDADNSGVTPVTDFGDGNVPLAVQMIQLTDEQALFTTRPFIGMGGVPDLPAYQWDRMAGTVIPLGNWSGNGAYLPPTGERVEPYLNEAYPAAQPMGPTPMMNEVRVINNDGERVIYRTSDEIILSTTFVDSGRAVAVHLASAGNLDQAMTSTSRFILIERDGTITDIERTFEGYAAVFAAPGDDGAAITWTENPQGETLPPTQMAIIEADGSLRPFATIPAAEGQGFSPRFFAWSQPIAVAELPPFAALE